MGTKLYVRNFGTQLDATALEDLFMTVGDVESAVVSIDSSTGVERRVGYVKMATEQQAMDCIHRFNGQSNQGYTMIVTEDAPHVPNPNFVKKKQPKVAAKRKPAPKHIKSL